MDEGLSLAWLPKAAAYGLGQLAIGIGIVRRLSRRSGLGAIDGADFEHWLTRLARVLALFLVIALALRLWAQTASAFGASDAWTLENLRVIALESRWGNGWRVQMAAVAVLLAAAVALPFRHSTWILFEMAAVGLAVAMPLLGHAAGSAWRHGVHAVHILGAAAWLGTLGVMTLAAWNQRSGSRDSLVLNGLVRRFSPIAMAAAAFVAITGIVAAWLYVGSWAALVSTQYGRMLLLKLTAAVVVGVCGWSNWRDARNHRPPRLTVVTLEWLAALSVICLTAVLTETEHP